VVVADPFALLVLAVERLEVKPHPDNTIEE